MTNRERRNEGFVGYVLEIELEYRISSLTLSSRNQTIRSLMHLQRGTTVRMDALPKPLFVHPTSLDPIYISLKRGKG